MSLELKLLVWSVALAFAQCLVAVAGATLQVGLPTLAGSREGLPTMTGWAGHAATRRSARGWHCWPTLSPAERGCLRRYSQRSSTASW